MALTSLLANAAVAIGKVVRGRRAKSMERQRVKIAHAKPGTLVEISGRVHAETRVDGEVVCTRTRLERDDGGMDSDWQLVREELQHVPVFIEDDSSDLAAIDMSHATIVIVRSDSTLSRPELPSSHVLDWASAHGVRVSSTQMLRLTVESIKDGDTLYVLGTPELVKTKLEDPYRSARAGNVRVHIAAKVVSQETIEELITTRRLEG